MGAPGVGCVASAGDSAATAYTGRMSLTLTMSDGLNLQWREWLLAGPRGARGTVLVVHGLGEHIGRYAHVAARLNGWGWNVAGYF